MRSKMPVLLKLSFGILSFTVFAFGCASFPGKELPLYKNDQISPPVQRFSVSYDVKAFEFGKENAKFAKVWQEEVEKVFKASPLFLEVSSTTRLGEYQCSFEARKEGEEATAIMSGLISGLTFAVIPAYGKDEYILTVDVKKENRVLKTYQYKDHVETWAEILLILLTPWHFPPTVSREVYDNMIMNFLHDFAQDVGSGVLLAAQQ